VPELRFLADMNISPLTVRELKRHGWDIVRVSEVLDPKAKDSVILSFAGESNRVVITQDIDFSALLAVGGRTGPSVITLRLEEPRPLLVARRLAEVVSEMGTLLGKGIIVSVDETSARYRDLPIGAESEE